MEAWEKYKKQIITIPNLLSIFRLVLAVLFLMAYQGAENANRSGILAAILILSGITDFLDGKIARKFHMVSELGKILDPVADKVTQGILLLCLLTRYPLARAVFLLFLIKETYMAVAGAKVIAKAKKNEGAMWYGKVSTAVFYAVMIILVFFPHVPAAAANLMIGAAGVFMMIAFVMYAGRYRKIRRETDAAAGDGKLDMKEPI